MAIAPIVALGEDSSSDLHDPLSRVQDVGTHGTFGCSPVASQDRVDNPLVIALAARHCPRPCQHVHLQANRLHLQPGDKIR